MLNCVLAGWKLDVVVAGNVCGLLLTSFWGVVNGGGAKAWCSSGCCDGKFIGCCMGLLNAFILYIGTVDCGTFAKSFAFFSVHYLNQSR